MRPKPDKVPHPFVHVTWLDAESDTSWRSLDDVTFEGAASLKAPNDSVGWKIHEDKHWVTIAATISWTGEWMYTNLARIPVAMVIKTKPIKT